MHKEGHWPFGMQYLLDNLATAEAFAKVQIRFFLKLFPKTLNIANLGFLLV